MVGVDTFICHCGFGTKIIDQSITGAKNTQPKKTSSFLPNIIVSNSRYTHQNAGYEIETFTETQGQGVKINYQGSMPSNMDFYGDILFHFVMTDSANPAINITSINVFPRRMKLGSLLLYECCKQGSFHCANRVYALNAVPDAYSFYIHSGFHVDSAMRESLDKMAPVLPFETTSNVAGVGNPANLENIGSRRIFMNKCGGTWSGELSQIQHLTYACIKHTWI
ncbi:Uncharacterised protein [BD1-7 clade bacterium]|uniref:Uncharacterized protein n=1 Tax=BD1-7 clade bacterium TaxID=2029982 RepID=A0A5S9N713_9GAMM|nr:Uncharacterised protein [BD1-7 clade bacterium]